MARLNRRQRIVSAAVLVALLASIGLLASSSTAVTEQDVLVNGSFESGFTFVPGCGMVGSGWGCFTNGGDVSYGFYDDQWSRVVGDGLHSQLLELNTMQVAASQPDRFAGIYQSVSVVPGALYRLSLQGLMREQGVDPREDAYRYRVQWGYTASGIADWTAVSNWQELNWDRIDERTSPGALQSFNATLVAPSQTLTLFFRVWKKWGTTHKELDVNLDAIHLFGPACGSISAPVIVPTVTVSPDTLVCADANLLYNGGFENGFQGGVANGWAAFTSGGRAAYGFYDEMWPPVVADGSHGQLIEINSKGFAASEPDRFAGIFQTVNGLLPGSIYRFSLAGLMREEASHPDEDLYRYRVQWGFAAASQNSSAASISNWTDLPWNTIYLRTAPGAMSSFSTTFRAPAASVVLAIRAVKKWPTTGRELDVNLDAVSLTGCSAAPGVALPPISGDSCRYVVIRGDTLGRIAARFATSVAALAELNRLVNPNLLFAGQVLSLPCSGAASAGNPPSLPDPVPPVDSALPGCLQSYTVTTGDTLYTIAAGQRTTIANLMLRNRLANPNLLYTGQLLCIDR